jgi:cellulose synthase/poly-beta-1,6-N-acetylglucosamine synthase-like glycosyltransferase
VDVQVATRIFISKSMMGFMSLLVLIYCICILTYTFRFKAFGKNEIKVNRSKTKFSIIIPFRNEEEHLPQLLHSIIELDYPSTLFEVLLVDDASEDHSKSICEEWQRHNPGLKVSILENKGLAKSPKKSAILTALQKASGDYILTTDADCQLPESWLLQYDNYIQYQPSDLIAGPVKIIEEKSFWTKFQVLDLMSLQVIGLGSFKTASPLFCNAANLCYRAQSLKDLQAFSQHKDIISGDDVFNLEVFQQNDKIINAIVDERATVWTKAENNFGALTQQRIRWASKTKYYKNKWAVFLGVIVLATNLCLVMSLVLALFYQDFDRFYWLWFFKLSIDFYTLYSGNLFFKFNICWRDYLIMLFIYPFVSSYFGLLSLNGSYQWKGRNHRF